MRIIYFDANGRHMEMESETEQEVIIPIVCRKYVAFQSYAIRIGNYNDTALDKTSKRNKNQGKFEVYYGRIDGANFDGKQNSLIISDFPRDFDIEFRKAYEYWFNKLCSYDEYLLKPEQYHFGHTCLWCDTNVFQATDISAHLFGKCILKSQGIRNALFYVHGTASIEDD